MPSEKEIEEIVRHDECNTYVLSCYLSSDELYKALRNDLHLMVDAYLSMKSERDTLILERDNFKLEVSIAVKSIDRLISERDKYKAIAEADTKGFSELGLWLMKQDSNIVEDFIPNTLAVSAALALREKES